MKNGLNNFFTRIVYTKHFRYGNISCALGIIGFIISFIALYLLNKVLNPVSKDGIITLIKLLNFVGKIEIPVKIIGIVFGALGVFQHSNKKYIALAGVMVNIISLVFSYYIVI